MSRRAGLPDGGLTPRLRWLQAGLFDAPARRQQDAAARHESAGVPRGKDEKRVVSTLLLVRHGQASIHAQDYDVLTDKGLAQAQALGRAWAARGEALDAIYVGPRRRHRDTCDALVKVARTAGCDMPTPRPLPEFDEMDVPMIAAEAMERVLPSCPTLRDQLQAGQLDDRGREAMRHLAGIMRHLLKRWAEADPKFDDVESYQAFRTRVRDRLWQLLREQGRGKTVAVVSSGGPISLVLQAALDLSTDKTLDLMFVLRNASVTALRFTEHAFTVDSINITSHLSPKLLSYV